MFKYFSRTEQIKRKRGLEQQIIAKEDIQAILEAKWKLQRILACEQAHLVCYSREYLGGGSRAGDFGPFLSPAHFARRLAGGGCQDCRAQIPQTSEPVRRLAC